jgi:transcription initiation factor IIF auxiliary subunit
MSIQFSNYCMEAELSYEGRRYDWCVFAGAEKEMIDRIASITYHLHPTFPNPTRIATNKEHRFPLVSSGWGEFSVGIKIEFTDGSRESTSYWLRLREDNWPKKAPPSQFATDNHAAVYGVLAEGTYRWRKLETLIKKTGLVESAVCKILQELEDADLARKSYLRSIEGQEMWGATMLVGVLPRL